MPRFLIALAAALVVSAASAFEETANLLPDGMAGEAQVQEAQTNSYRYFIAGGGEMSREVMLRFVELSGGPTGHVAIIPSAYPFATHTDLEECFSEFVELFHDPYRLIDVGSELDPTDGETQWREILETATGVWIGGGDQGRLADLFRNTGVPELLKQLLARGGIIGGTSAGASILSEVMIREGTSTDAVADAGFGLIHGLIIDQHFRQRDRLLRLQKLLFEYPDRWGMGIDEGTVAVIEGTKLYVLGEGRVWLGRIDEAGEVETIADLDAEDGAIDVFNPVAGFARIQE